MEFSFNYYDFLQTLEANPEYMVMWAAFGVPVLMFALALPLFILRKIGLQEQSKPFANVAYLSLGITWILGFVTMMIMMFTNVSGIHLFIVWVLMFITYLAFTLFNYKRLMKGVTAISKKK